MPGTGPTFASERIGSGAVCPKGCPATQRELCGEAARDLPPQLRQPRVADITGRSALWLQRHYPPSSAERVALIRLFQDAGLFMARFAPFGLRSRRARAFAPTGVPSASPPALPSDDRPDQRPGGQREECGRTGVRGCTCFGHSFPCRLFGAIHPVQ
jgi:hypothetical protein